MRVVIVAAALVTAAFTFVTGVVLAEDAPVIPRPVDFLDWSRTVESIRSSDRTEAGKVDALRKRAAESLVQRRVKLVDAVEIDEGRFEFTLCDIFGGPWREKLILPREDRPAAVGWRKWDRLRLRYAITIAKSDDITYTLLSQRAAELDRTPNPGIVYPPDAVAPASRENWLSSLGQVAEHVWRKDWVRAYARLETMTSKEFSIPGRISTVSAYGTFVQPEMNVAFETKDGTFRIGPPRGTVSVLVEDPQIGEALQPDLPVTLALSVAPVKSPRALQEAGGVLDYRWRLYRVRTESKDGR